MYSMRHGDVLRRAERGMDLPGVRLADFVAAKRDSRVAILGGEMSEELYRLGTGYIQDGAVVLAEDAMLKVRAWDAAVAAGALEQPKVYAQRAVDMKRSALMDKEVAWQKMAAANDELAAAMKAIEGA